MHKGDGRCALTITSTGLMDEETWWALWNSGVGLAGVCARQGKQGRDVGLGTSNSENFEVWTNAFYRTCATSYCRTDLPFDRFKLVLTSTHLWIVSERYGVRAHAGYW